MALKYFALLTNIGAAKLSNMAALGEKLDITSLAVGDGGGVSPTPNQAQTKLINEVRRAQLNSLSVDKDNDSQIIAEQIIPESAGGWWIREIGLFDADGDLIAIANCPETYKATTEEGSGRTQVIRMLLTVSSTDAVTLKIDPSVVLATRQYVDDAVIEVKAYTDKVMKDHEGKANPHSQYPLIANALKEMADAGLVAKVLENLGLGGVADAPYVKSRGTNANGSWVLWSDGAIECMGTVGVYSGLGTVKYPIALPAISRMFSMAERLATDPGSVAQLHVSMIIDSTVTTSGFQARCQQENGAVSSFSFSWRVYYAPV